MIACTGSSQNPTVSQFTSSSKQWSLHFHQENVTRGGLCCFPQQWHEWSLLRLFVQEISSLKSFKRWCWNVMTMKTTKISRKTDGLENQIQLDGELDALDHICCAQAVHHSPANSHNSLFTDLSVPSSCHGETCRKTWKVPKRVPVIEVSQWVSTGLGSWAEFMPNPAWGHHHSSVLAPVLQEGKLIK